MAEKILNTRIQLKYDTLSNWQSSAFNGDDASKYLKAGEVAVVQVETNVPNTLAPVMFKVGTGNKKFDDLDWASAKAADVYGWAKKAGIEIEETGTGKFVTGLSWNAETNKLAITRANVEWNDIQNKPDVALKSDLPTELGVMSVTGKDAIVSEGDKDVTVSLKLDNTGNVTLSQGADGLKAEVDTGVHTVSLVGGTNNGTLKLTVDGNPTDNIAVTGLGSAAYTEASAYATNAENGAKAAVDALAEDVGNVESLETTNKEIVAAINEVRTAVGTGGTAAVVALTKSEDGLTYTLTQGGNSVGTINIPKDMVVKSGEVVTNPAGQTEGTYIVLTLANTTEDKIYVNVGTLVDIYKAKAGAAQVQIAIDSVTREVSATIVADSITATELATDAVVTAKIANGNVTKEKLSTTVQTSLDNADNAAAAIATYGDIVTHNVVEFQPAGNYKTIQEVVAETGAANQTLKISQDTNGVITATPVDIAITATQVSGLANIATSGNVNDLIQTEGDVLVFNCGSASTVL